MQINRSFRSAADHNVASIVRAFGKHLRSLVQQLEPTHLVPLETKGAILLEHALQSVSEAPLPPILYPKAFRYLPPEEAQRVRALLVDDVLFSGRTLKEAKRQLESAGVRPDRITPIALLDYSAGQPDIDYFADIQAAVQRTKPRDLSVPHHDALQFLQNEILHSRMPSTYDLVLLEAQGVRPWDYQDLLRQLQGTGRLLEYGRRGAFLTSTILLDDLGNDGWDFPAKIRQWYHAQHNLLRLAPVGAANMPASDLEGRLTDLLVNAIPADRQRDREDAAFDAQLLARRVGMLARFRTVLPQNLSFELDTTHLVRYFPGVAEQLAERIKEHFLQGAEPLPPYEQRQTAEPIEFLAPATSILEMLRHAYLDQAREGIDRKDFVARGLSGKEIATALTDRYTIDQLHAALDYCFDLHYVTTYSDRSNGERIRRIRTTEQLGEYLDHEVIGGTVILSDKRPTPAWLLSKAFAVLENTTKDTFEDRIASRKAYFGSISGPRRANGEFLYWKDAPSKLWHVEHEKEEEHVRFVATGEQRKELPRLIKDTRVAPHLASLQACLFLMREGQRKAGVLLNILTDTRGGADYLRFNLEELLYATTRANVIAATRHHAGLREKLEFLQSINDTKEPTLERLERRIARLDVNTPLVAEEARSLLRMAVPFSDDSIYNAFRELHGLGGAALSAVRDGKLRGLRAALRGLGIDSILDADNIARDIYAITERRIVPLARALSAYDTADSDFARHLLRGGEARFVLAYDLHGDRKDHAKRNGLDINFVNHFLHCVAKNWIVALGGQLAKAEVTGGDLQYGYFETLEDALQAGAWMLHHASLLHHTSPIMPGPAYGVAITRGFIRGETGGDLYSPAMDESAHLLKGKLKEAHDDIAGRAGRKHHQLAASPAYLMLHDDFPLPQVPGIRDAVKYTAQGGTTVNVAPFDTSAYRTFRQLPWSHRSISE